MRFFQVILNHVQSFSPRTVISCASNVVHGEARVRRQAVKEAFQEPSASTDSIKLFTDEIPILWRADPQRKCGGWGGGGEVCPNNKTPLVSNVG